MKKKTHENVLSGRKFVRGRETIFWQCLPFISRNVPRNTNALKTNGEQATLQIN